MNRGATPARQRRAALRRAVAGFALAAGSAVFSARSVAQYKETEEGPIFGEKTERRWLNLGGWHGELTLSYLGAWNDTKTSEGRTKFTENVFSESLTLGTSGSIIHPNLVDFTADGTFELRQQDYQTESSVAPSRSTNNNDWLTQFNIDANILRNQKLTFNINLQRYDTTVNRDFGPTLIQSTTAYTGSANWRDKVFPTRVLASHTETSADDPEDEQGFTTTSDVFFWSTQWIMSPNSQALASYTYNQSDSSSDLGQPVSFQSDQFNLQHYYSFGASSQHSLSSSLEMFSQAGDFPTDRLRIDENLNLQHTDNFQTYYRYNYTLDTRDDFEQSTHQGEAGFRHKLYKSLFTTGTVGLLFQDVQGELQSDEFYARIEFDYTKQVPMGTLGLNLALNYSYQKNTVGGTSVSVFDEQYSFSSPLGIVINRQDVNPSSIVVTNRAGNIVYRPGLDYTVLALPDRVQIQRVLGGAIPANSDVLIDYNFAPQGSSSQNTYGFGLGGSYSFDRGPLKGFVVYARYFFQDQSISSDQDANFVPADVNDTVIGARYKIGNFLFLAEQQWHDSTLSPFDATRLGAGYSSQIFRDAVFTANLDYNSVTYKDNGNEIEYWNASTSLDYALSREWHLTGSASYRNQTDNITGNFNGYEQQIQLQWNKRQTSVDLIFRNVNLDTEGEDSSYQSVQVSIRRAL